MSDCVLSRGALVLLNCARNGFDAIGEPVRRNRNPLYFNPFCLPRGSRSTWESDKRSMMRAGIERVKQATAADGVVHRLLATIWCIVSWRGRG